METAHNGDIAIAYETFGPPGGAPLLLISGTGAQMLIWPDDFCAALADRGFHVARFDNRDTGLSTHLTGTPAPGWLKTMLRPSAAPYRLDDMADDALAVMDALGWPAAHVAGASLGGMIAQALAIRASRPGCARSPRSCPRPPPASPPCPRSRRCGPSRGRPAPRSPARIRPRTQAVALKRVIGSPGYPLDEETVRDIAAPVLRTPPRCRRRRPAPARRHHRLRGPAQRARGPAHSCARHPRRARPGDPAQGRPGNRGRHPRRQTGHLPRHGPRPAPSTVAIHPGRDLRPRGAGRGGEPLAAQPGPVITGPEPGRRWRIQPLHARRLPGARRGLARLQMRPRAAPRGPKPCGSSRSARSTAPPATQSPPLTA